MDEVPPEQPPTPQRRITPRVLFTIGLWAVALFIISVTPTFTGIFIFPVGLFAFMSLPLGQHEAAFAAQTFLWGGWAIYVTLSLWFVATRVPSTRVVIGAVFVLLIAFNIGGCAQLLNRMKHGF
jgi:hypothetical protein